MSPDVALALFAFAFVMTVTPGPNNLMLMASGMNHGLRRSAPHVAGVTLGVVVLVLVVGAGLGQALARSPAAAGVLKALSLGYMLWLAWRIATAAPPAEGAPSGRPLSFLEAAAFQWVNPKAWGMAVTAVGAYAPGAAWAALAFLVVGPPCNVLWVAMGQGLRRMLADRRTLRAFNLGMALLLLGSLWPVLRS